MQERLQFHLFGPPQFTYQGKPITGFISSKARALLIYLAVTGRTHSRAALAELLWADTPTTARASLRKVLSNLRRLNGVTLVEVTNDTIALDLQNCWTDVSVFEQDTTAQVHDTDVLQHTVQHYQAPFLDGFPLSLSYEFEAWALGERTRLHTQMIELLARLITAHTETEDLAQAIVAAQQLLAVEPWHEETHCHLMRLLARTGKRSAALAQYQRCVEILRAELDAEPAAQTRELHEEIRAGIYPPQPRAVAAAHEDLTDRSHNSASRDNLPMPATRLVGRQSMLAAIAAWLQRDEVRLITLTGPGGVGKTRLAIQTGHNLVTAFRDGVVFVDLAPIRAAGLASIAIADALGLREGADNRPLLEYMAGELREKQLLLVIDNFEHLIEAAPVLSALLAKAPQLKILSTSREVLHLQGEFEFAVSPLHLPSRPTEHQQPIAEVESVQLFIQQARAVQPYFSLTEAVKEHIAEICIHLDGLPLAIELAAARTKILDVATIAARLQERFALLQHGPRDAPVRHQTLQNAIDWSYNLLNPEEQTLCCRLALFVGGCTLDAIEAVCPPNNGTIATLDLVTSLVDKSLLMRQGGNGQGPRFIQLETILAYGRQKLRELGELEGTQAAHAHYFLALAERAEPMLFGREQQSWLEILGQEHDNLRAALTWSIEQGQASVAARLGFALWHFWYIRAHHLEGMRWLEQILSLPLSTAERARGLYGAGMLARRLRDDQTVALNLNDALCLFRQLEDEYYIASALRVVGFTDYRMGKMSSAQQKLEEALTLFKQLNNVEGVAVTLLNLAYICHNQGNYAAGVPLLEESLAIRRRTGNQHGIANCLDALGMIQMYRGNLATAKLLLTESCTIYAALGNKQASGIPVDILGSIAYLEGAYANADMLYEQAHELSKQSANRELLAQRQLHLALSKLRLGHRAQAWELVVPSLHTFIQIRATDEMDDPTVVTDDLLLELAIFALVALATDSRAIGLQVAAKVCQERGQRHPQAFRAAILGELETAVADIRGQMNAATFAAHWTAGETMSLPELIAAALSG